MTDKERKSYKKQIKRKEGKYSVEESDRIHKTEGQRDLGMKINQCYLGQKDRSTEALKINWCCFYASLVMNMTRTPR